jgi:hypothetical protein
VNGFGWNAHVYESPSDWAGDTKRVVFFERRPNGGGRQLVGWDDHRWPIFEEVEQGAMLSDGFPVPTDALRALGEQLKPGPSQGEVKRLEDALAHEREQVRWLSERLAELAGRPPGGT